MIELRPDQRLAVDKCKSILARDKIAYLAAMQRTGKSIMGLTVAYESGWRRIAILTKVNAIKKIQIDIASCNYPIKVHVCSFHHLTVGKLNPDDFDAIIIDEANEAAGTFPDTTKRIIALKKLVGFKPLLLMSGTPTAESWSQLYNQFGLSQSSPFKQWKTFYQWAKIFVKHYDIQVVDDDGNVVIKKQVKQKRKGKFMGNDYSEGLEEVIRTYTDKYMVYLSQEEAGFTQLVEEEIMFVKISDNIYRLMEVLKEDKIYTMKCGDIILADNPAKLQSVMHQLSSGTIKISAKKFHILDESKAWAIKLKFKGKKIAIFYKFLAEFELLKKVFPSWTDDDIQFNESNHLVYLKQIVSGRSGVDLQTADFLVYYNIDFSATSYWQGRERMANKNRTKLNKMYWIFSEHGFEKRIHKAVVRKQRYTISHFRRDLKKWTRPSAANQLDLIK